MRSSVIFSALVLCLAVLHCKPRSGSSGAKSFTASDMQNVIYVRLVPGQGSSPDSNLLIFNCPPDGTVADCQKAVKPHVLTRAQFGENLLKKVSKTNIYFESDGKKMISDMVSVAVERAWQLAGASSNAQLQDLESFQKEFQPLTISVREVLGFETLPGHRVIPDILPTVQLSNFDCKTNGTTNAVGDISLVTAYCASKADPKLKCSSWWLLGNLSVSLERASNDAGIRTTETFVDSTKPAYGEVWAQQIPEQLKICENPPQRAIKVRKDYSSEVSILGKTCKISGKTEVGDSFNKISLRGRCSDTVKFCELKYDGGKSGQLTIQRFMTINEIENIDVNNLPKLTIKEEEIPLDSLLDPIGDMRRILEQKCLPSLSLE